ncbi:MAG: ankyrin repeat domain-containing protein [bacterium]|nr:ankyrin repeat domain-containing protein [bacterium]MDE0439294.1 ankyrin repeat domain-containing protein [bacterium]
MSMVMEAVSLFRLSFGGWSVASRACGVFLIVATVMACGSDSPPTSPGTDRAALVRLYRATAGADWIRNTNWLTDAPMDQWHGVGTDTDGRVVELVLFQNNLSGFIPTEVGDLDRLVRLDIANTHERGDENDEDLDLGDVFVAFADAIESLTDDRPPEFNDLYGCVPRRLDGQLDMERSFLGNLSFCDKKGEARMHRLALNLAIERGDTAEVSRLVRDEGRALDLGGEGAGVLFNAVESGDAEIVTALVDAGADANATDRFSSEPVLFNAVESADAEIVAALVKAGADVNATDFFDDPVLQSAVKSGDIDMVVMLIEAGALVNAGDDPVLLGPIRRGDDVMVATLVAAGADVNAIDDWSGRSMLALARRSRDEGIVRILVDAGAEE